MKDGFSARLTREIEAWVREGLVTPAQGERIAARYPVAGAPSRLIAIITLIGGALIASGLGLVIAHNWERLSDWTKIGGLLVLLAGFYAGGFELRERGFARAGDALLMTGAALFLCGIALVAQVFHLNSRPPNGVLLWIAGILPVAYLLRSGPVLFLAVTGALVWIGMEAASPDSLLYMGGSERVFGAIDPFSNWVGWMALAVAIGTALVAAGVLHQGRYGKFERVFDFLGLLLFGGGLYFLTFLRHNGGTPEHWIGFPVAPPLLFGALGGVLTALAWKNDPTAPPRTRAFHAGTLLGGIIMALAATLAGSFGARGVVFDEAYSFLCAVFLLAGSISFIAAGVGWDRPRWVNLGLCFVGLNIVSRYFDLVGTMLEGGMLFITGGALILFIGVVLEKQRRRLMRQMAAAGGA